MKKALSFVLSAALVAVMAFSMAACKSKDSGTSSSGNDSSSSSSQSSSTQSSSQESSASESSSSQSSLKYNTVSEFVASDAMQAQMQTMKDQLESDEMSMEITGDDVHLIYTYTFKTDIDLSGAADTLKAGLDAEASTFENVASMLKTAVNVDDPIVVVRYLDKDGSEIYSQEFTAK